MSAVLNKSSSTSSKFCLEDLRRENEKLKKTNEEARIGLEELQQAFDTFVRESTEHMEQLQRRVDQLEKERNNSNKKSFIAGNVAVVALYAIAKVFI